MARKPEHLTHPATMMARRAQAAMYDSAINSQSWRLLTEQQKTYLALYIDTRDARQAAAVLGVEMSWIDEQEQNPAFLEIESAVLDHPMELAHLLMKESQPAAVLKLRELMRRDDIPSTQLQAIKVILNYTEEQKPTEQNLLLNNVNIKMFSDKPGKPEFSVSDLMEDIEAEKAKEANTVVIDDD